MLGASSPADLIAEMQAYYAHRAPVYDASMRYDDPEFVRSLAVVFDALREEMRDRAVLEIACGPGFWTSGVAEAARSIVSTDYNEATLALARVKAMAPARVRFAQADAYELSSVDGMFTGAFAVDWLAHVPRSRLPAFLTGLHRKLVPPARVAFCDQLPRPDSITGVYDAEMNHVQARTLPDGSRYSVIKNFFSDAEYDACLAPYGDALAIRRFVDQRRVLVAYTFAGT